MIEDIILSSLALYGALLLFNNFRMGKIAFKVHKFLYSSSPRRAYTIQHIAMELEIDKDDVVISCVTDNRIRQAKIGSYNEWILKATRHK